MAWRTSCASWTARPSRSRASSSSATAPPRSSSAPVRRPRPSGGGSNRRSASTRTSGASASWRRRSGPSRRPSRRSSATRRRAATSSVSDATGAPARRRRRGARPPAAEGPEAALSAIECHRCPWGAQPRCDREWRELETLTERLGVRRRALEQFRSAYWQEFLNVVEVLEQFGAVRDRRLEPRGRLIAGLRHDNELLVAESVFRGVFTDLNAAEAAAVCSALIEEARSGEAAIARDFLKKRPRLRRKLDQLESLANTIHEAH